MADKKPKKPKKPPVSRRISKYSSGSKPGPKPQPGNRYPGGRLKPVKTDPNERIVEARKVLNLTEAGQRMGPIRFAYSKGWLSVSDMITAEVYGRAYHRAGLGGPGISDMADRDAGKTVVEDLEFDWLAIPPAQRDDLAWTAFKGKMSEIFDNTFKTAAGADDKRPSLRTWKALGLSMTLAERSEVDLVVLRGSWPQWIIQRNHGRMDTAWEAKRLLLQSGLAKMTKALKVLNGANDNGQQERAAG